MEKTKPLYKNYTVMIRFQHLEKNLGDNRTLSGVRHDNQHFVNFQSCQLYIEKSFVNVYKIKDNEETEQRKDLAIKRTILMFRLHFPKNVLAPQLFIENQDFTNQYQSLLECPKSVTNAPH